MISTNVIMELVKQHIVFVIILFVSSMKVGDPPYDDRPLSVGKCGRLTDLFQRYRCRQF